MTPPAGIPADRPALEASLAAALYFENYAGDKDRAAHMATMLAEHVWPLIEAALTAARREGWDRAHGQFCEYTADTPDHPNPYDSPTEDTA